MTSSYFVQTLLLDLRYALRVLWKSPAFTVVALLTLVLGITANVVVFGVLDAVLLRPLDVTDPQSLYQVRHERWMIGRLLTTSYPAFEDFRRRNTTFSGMAAVYGYSHAELRWRNGVRNVSGNEVTGNYFDLLGVQPQLGRFFHASDEHGPGSAPYVVLSDELWRSMFHADPAVVGTTVELKQHPFTVLGIAGPQFHGTERFAWPDYWIPIVNEQQLERSDYLHDRKHVAVTVIGRLKPGLKPRQATEDLNAIAAELGKEYPTTDDGQPLRLIHPGLLGDASDVIRGFLYGATVLALLVLAAACANLATLFASRVADRSRELAVRIALGSSRSRLVTQLLSEAVVVSLMGGAAGLLTANVLLNLLNHWPAAVGAHLAAGIDAHVFLEALALTFGSALLFGMVPAWHAWRSSPLQAMKNGAADGASPRPFVVRDLLLGAQIAICTLLVTGSLVSVRGMERALRTPLGFQPQGAMLAELHFNQLESGAEIEKKKGIIDAMRTIPGVTAVGIISRTPFTGGMHGIPIFLPGTTELKLNNSVLASYVFTISPGYLEAARTRLLSGRDISWHDTANSPHVAIVNQTFARKMWRESPAIGKRFIVSGNLTEVVGIAEDGKYHHLEESPHPVVYLPLSQNQDSDTTFVVRSARTPNEMAGRLEHTLSAIAPNVPITIQNWSDTLADELFPARAAAAALGAMGLLAAMLAVTGIFGMAAYGVSRRMKELGIRVALGARRTQLMRAALGRPIVLLGTGSVVGVLSGVLASQLLEQLVYEANPRDPLVIAGALLTMMVLGVAGAAIPARRALTVDPSELMRE